MDLSFLPAVNATLNVAATALLVAGRFWIRRGRVALHRRAMLGAFTVSSLFLVLYVLHKAWRGFENTPYHGEGALRVLYLAILFSHLTLAMAVPVLALRLVQLGLGGRIERHRRLVGEIPPRPRSFQCSGFCLHLLQVDLHTAVLGTSLCRVIGGARFTLATPFRRYLAG